LISINDLRLPIINVPCTFLGMAKIKHPHSALIDQAGSATVCDAFRLSPQTLHMWRVRGIPQIKRISFAKMCAERGVAVPGDFFEAFETRRTAA
jgi:hypothetical protein